MHGNTGRLVHHDKRLVFIDNRGLQALQQPLGDRRGLIALGQAHRRHPHDVASLQLVLRLDTTLVDPHLALAQDAVDQRLGHALERGDEEIVDALAGKLRRDFDQLNAGSRRGIGRHGGIITIFYGIEALNHNCYSRERRQKRQASGIRLYAGPDHRNSEDARPSYGAFASLTKCLESPPALCREDRKKTTSAVFHLLTRFFSPYLCPPPSFPRIRANASEIPALDMSWRQPGTGLAKNATRCGFSARQHRIFRDTCRVEMHSLRTVWHRTRPSAPLNGR